MINFILHPTLSNPENKDYKKAKLFAYLMLVLFIFLVPYCIYFAVNYPEDTVKNWNNIVSVGLFAVGILLIRFTPYFKIPLMYVAILSFIPIMISVYHTGGIYSVDLCWVFVCIITQSIFLGYKWSIFSALMICGYITFLFVTEINISADVNFFKQYVVSHNSIHYYFTWVFVIILLSALTSTFARVFEKTSKKLEELSQEKILELEIRVKQKTEELSQLRSNLARDFHDEMGNKLSSISILSQTVALTIKNKEQNQEAAKLLETIEQRSKELFDGTKDFIWAIDFKSDYVFEFFVYLRDFGEQFFNGMEISFYSYTTIAVHSEESFKATASRQLVLVCKEIMTNAAKHAQAQSVTFSISQLDHIICIAISDNGIGFDTNFVFTNGLKNIQKRIEAIGAKLTIDSKKDGGTTFTIIIHIDAETTHFG